MTNGSFEQQASTPIQGWTVWSGSGWVVGGPYCCTGGSHPGGFQSTNSAWPGIVAGGELRQDVDVSGYASLIDAGRMRFAFQAALFVKGAAPRDRGRVVLEYRDPTGQALFGSYDSGEPDTVFDWLRIGEILTPPPGTRMVRVRLVAARSFNFDDTDWLDAYFDAVELRPLANPTAIARDASVAEGASGLQSMPFRIDLTCPALQPVTLAYATSDGTASAPGDYQPTAGTLTIAAGGTFGTVDVPVFGDNTSEGNETLFLVVSSAVNAGVQPPGRATGTILDDESTIQVLDAAVAEGSSGLTDLAFRVELSRAVAQEVRVDFATRPGSATTPADFVAASGTVVFAAGETQKTIVVQVVGDTTSEPDEDFFVDLSEPRNAGIARATAKGTILGDEIGLSVSDAEVVERDTQTVKALFEVTLSAPSSAAVTAQWTTEDAFATAGADYRAASGTVTIPAGQLSQTIEIDVFGDTLVEPTETFFLRLSEAVNAGLNDAEGVGRIIDNDDCPSSNLLVNGSAEAPLLLNGKIASWTEVAGFNWQRFAVGPPLVGSFVFFPGSVNDAELRQDVDVSNYAALIDRGIQRFVFEGFIRSAAETPADPGRIVVELLDADKALLTAHDSGEVTNVASWQAVSIQHTAPAGTRFVRVRLIARRVSPGNLDAYFDALALRSLGTPVLDVQGGLLREDAPGGVGQVVLSASCAPASDLTLSVAASAGTASPGVDFGAIAPAATLPAGGIQATIDVPLIDDETAEPLESIPLQITSTSAVLARPVVAFIVDDDPEPTVSVTPLHTVETDAGSTAAFVLALSNPSSSPAQVAFTTRNGSALAGQDFVQATGTITFAPGELVREVPIAVLGDTVEEPEEQLYLQLSALTGLAGPTEPIAGTIRDDDPGADCPGPELIRNGGNERPLARGDLLDSWTSASGRWKRLAGTTAPEGRYHFAPPDLDEAVLWQDVDVSAYATFIDAGTVRFDFSASVVSGGSGPADAARVLLEHRDAAGVVRGELDTGAIVGASWQSIQQRLTVPVGTRSVRVSLIATRNGSTAGNDAFFDRVSLRAVGVRSVSVGDATVREGAAPVSARFALTLSCAAVEPIAAPYATVDGTATAGADYAAAQGTVTFPAGELQAQVSVDVLDDVAFELPQRFELRLAGQAGLAVLRAGIGTIEDDDGAPTCTYQPPVGAFTPVLEWAWKGSTVEPTFDDVIMTPVVADLTGDGVAEIVFNSRADHTGTPRMPGVLRAIDGLDGRAIFDVADPALRTISTSHVAVGDLDGDGALEVIALRYTPPGVMAFDAAGRLKWFNGSIDAGAMAAPAIANLDGVGNPEVVIGGAVLNSDGTLRWRVDERAGGPNNFGVSGIAAVADLDLDGTQEIVAGNRAWSHTGAVVFATSLSDGFPAVANFDGDPHPEIVLVTDGRVRLLEHDGRLKWESAPAGLRHGGAPTVADFDNDGQPEIGVAGESRYVLLEGDGSVRWSIEIQDGSSFVTGSSVFDFEGDGSAEVVYRDEKVLRVLRGTDGAVLFSVANPSCTGSENPVIADVDGDGNAEIVVPRDQLCGFGSQVGVFDQGLFVFGDAADNWLSARPLWNQHAYSVTNVDDDASIPARPVPSWAPGQPNTFRAQRPETASAFAAPDLLPLALTVDESACPAQVRLVASIANAGDAVASPPVDVTFTRGLLAGGTVLGTRQLEAVLDPGGQEEIELFFDTPGGTQHTFCVAVDAASPPVNECREQNNSTCVEVGELCRPPTASVADVSVLEAASTARLTLSLDRPPNGAVTVPWTTADGTTVAGADYQAVTAGSVTFSPGQVSAPLDVPLLPDALDEVDETFTVHLAAAAGATLADGTAVVTIVDDDAAAGAIAIADVTVVEGDAGTTNATFQLQLSAPAASPVTVAYATAAGSAATPSDFEAASGEVTFAAGQTAASLIVHVQGDTLLEPDETFTVTLSSPVGATIEDGTATGTIRDDETCVGPNLLENSGAELAAGIGAIPHWQVVQGTEWQTRSINPPPAEGSRYFYAGRAAFAELEQDVDVSPYASRIADGSQAFAFEGLVRTLDEQPGDVARIVVEYRDAANAVVLGAFDSGDLTSPSAWLRIADTRTAPVGTGWIRVRLLATRFAGEPDDGYFDALALRSLRAPVLTIDDVAVDEGDVGTADVQLAVRLSCPVQGEIAVVYQTADGSAHAGADYQAVGPASATFPAGMVTRTLAIPVVGDSVPENDETFEVRLSQPQGAVLVDAAGTVTVRDSVTCPAASAIDYRGYTAAHCAVPQNAVTVHDQAALNAYLANFGWDGSKVRNVIVNFNPAGGVVIVSPCEIRMKGTGTGGYLDVEAEKVCLYGRKGVVVAEDHGNPDQGIVARAITLVSEEGNAGFSKGLVLAADAINVRALKEAKVGLSCQVTTRALDVVSTGDLSTSEAVIRQGSSVVADQILVQASRGATIGPSTTIDVNGALVVRSTGNAVGSVAKVSQAAHVTAGSMELLSGNKVTVEQQAILDIEGLLHANAAGSCTIAASAVISAGSTSGSCLP